MREGWTYKKLGECFPFIKNGANIKQLKDADGLPITRIETLSGGVFNRDRMGYASIYDSSKYSDYILEDGDLLMSHINSKTYIGRTVEYKKERSEVIIHGMNLLRLKADRSLILPSFMAYYTNSAIFKSDVARIRKDAVNQSSMAIGDLRKFDIPLPPKSQQEAIVSELDEINSLLALKREQLQKYDKLAQSLFYEMFGDPVENEKGWEVKNLADLCENKDSLRKPITASERITGSIPYYGASGIVDYVKDYIFDDEYLLVSEDGANLIARSTPIAFSIKGKTWVNNHAHILKFSNYSTQLFVEYNINLRDVSPFITGAVQPKLNQAKMSIIPIPLPPLSLQQQFASRIEQIESQKQQVQAAIEKLETLLASRMQYWFE